MTGKMRMLIILLVVGVVISVFLLCFYRAEAIVPAN